MARHHKRSRRRKHNPVLGGHRRRRHNPFRRHFRRHNPLPLATNEILPTVGGAIVGGVATSYVPSLVLGSYDTGFPGWAGNLAVAILGAIALAKYRSVALGWFIGGLTAMGGRIIDDLTGKQLVSYQMPTALSSYYGSSYVPLPATTSRVPMALPAAPAGAIAAGNASAARGYTGLGWNPRFSSRFAA